VHLLSSDTTLISSLITRYRPEIIRRDDLWGSLAREGVVAIAPRYGRVSVEGPTLSAALVGSPDGHADVRLAALLVRGSSCGWRGAQVELIVQSPGPAADDPALHGPVVGSFLSVPATRTRVRRYSPAAPSDSLAAALLQRTAQSMDSALAAAAGRRERPLTRPRTRGLEINTLADVDAADLLPIRIDDSRVRYAVALRERRVTAAGDTVVAATVMVWDSAGAWQQTVLRPTLLDLHRGRMQPRSGWVPVYWRRLQAVSGFAFGRDYLWMEQVDARDGRVLWGAIEPTSNTVVAASEVSGPCTR
jgi:hypothetical protein